MKPDKKTIIIKNPDERDLQFCASVIKRGGLVAFPTETVYGIGADALNEDAVRGIFLSKNRPADNPLILHLADVRDIHKFCTDVPVDLNSLKRFMPGPLTLVLKKSLCVPDLTSAGLPTAAVRVPSNKTARRLIKMSETAIAAPSANRSGRPSPTKAQHVIDDLYGLVDVIIDEGSSEIGVESTVVDLSSDTPVILRPGIISAEDLSAVFPGIILPHSSSGKNRALGEDYIGEGAPKAPGMKYRHYAPAAPLYIVGDIQSFALKISKEYPPETKFGILSLDENINLPDNFTVKNLGASERAQAQRLFAFLREFDDLGVELIFAPKLCGKNLSQAVANRLYKAASYIE